MCAVNQFLDSLWRESLARWREQDRAFGRYLAVQPSDKLGRQKARAAWVQASLCNESAAARYNAAVMRLTKVMENRHA